MKMKPLVLVCVLLLWNACGSEPPVDRPIIGVLYGTAQAILLKAEIDINGAYIRALQDCGAGTMRISVFDDTGEIMAALGRIDGLLIPGGFDISPSRYDELPDPKLERVDLLLDDLEATALCYCTEKPIPVLGICRGCQAINVYYGGSLYQDIPAHFGNKVAHRKSKDYLLYKHAVPCFHDVTVTGKTRLAEMIGADTVSVNTYHHQGVKRLAKGFVVSARGLDGFIEAVELPGPLFILGVQFHPEKMYLEKKVFSNIFSGFVKAASERRHR